MKPSFSDYHVVTERNEQPVPVTHAGARLPGRWYVLFLCSFLAFQQGWIWNTYGPIAIVVERDNVFGWNDSDVAWMGNWGPIAYMFCFYPTALFLDTYGLRQPARSCAFLLAASCGIRLLSTGPSKTCLILQHIGQMLNGMAGPFAMSAGTVLSSAWFSPEQRTTSTSIFVVANLAGVSASYLIGPIMVPNHNGSIEDVRRYLWLSFFISVVSLLLVVLYFPIPPADIEFAPSISSTVQRTGNMDGLKKLFKHKQFWLLATSYGAMTGIYSGWGPTYALIMKQLGSDLVPDPQTAGEWVGFFSGISGNVCGLLLSLYCDARFGRGGNVKRNALLVVSFLASVLYGFFTYVSAFPELMSGLGITGIYCICIIGGTLINCTPPLFFELSVDVVFPVAEGLTTNVLTVMNNFGGLVFLLIPSVGIAMGPWVMTATCICCVVAFICLVFTDSQNLERTKIDRSV